jgi:D-tyrosyl-tRNA(Tyr) deacylase
MGLFGVRAPGCATVTIVGLRDEDALISLFTITCFWYGFSTYTTHSSFGPKNGYFFVPCFPLLEITTAMKAVIQRVLQASVEIAGEKVGAIDKGIVMLLGVEKGDTTDDASWLMAKIINLRIFEDDYGKMNLSVLDVAGAILAVSQFTLAGNCSKGRRPSFDTAALPDEANVLYEFSVAELKRLGGTVVTGVFQADMQVCLINDGPVTFVLDTQMRKKPGC